MSSATRPQAESCGTSQVNEPGLSSSARWQGGVQARRSAGRLCATRHTELMANANAFFGLVTSIS